MATFIGSSQAGLAVAAAATLGVVLPSFVIILMIAALIRSFLKYSGVQAFLSGVRPCVVAMILATALTMADRPTAWFFFSFRKNQSGCARHRIVCLPSASARAIRKNMEEKALADSDDTDFGGAGDADLLERI